MKKYIAFTALSAMLLLSGCAERDLPLISTVELAEGSAPATELGSLGHAETEIAWEEAPIEPQELTEPPIIRIETIGSEIASCMSMTRCGYSWEHDGTAVIADSASPLQAYEHGDVTAVVNTLDLAKAPTVLLTNGGAIEYVRCWGADGVQEVEFTAEGEILLPAEPVGAVYEVSVTFPQGRCSYIFAAEQREPSDYSGSAEGAATPAYDPTAE